MRLAALILTAACLTTPSYAQDDDIVRLPGQGEVKKDRVAEVGAHRLAPGGGLMTSFDTDGNGRVSQAELNEGIAKAFETADANADGELTPLEQQDWASLLPTRDESLFNPARFDPNLDRIVSLDEFSAVIHTMADGYSEEGSSEVVLASLKRKPRRDDDAQTDDPLNRERLQRIEDRRNQF